MKTFASNLRSGIFISMSLANVLHLAAAQSNVVKGSAPGFASGVTGGGNAAPVYPKTITELKYYIALQTPQVIVISGTFDFVGSEGTSNFQACNAYACTPDSGGQVLLNTLGGCGSKPTFDVTLDTAGYNGLDINSDTTLVGINGATLNGKGLRFTRIKNVIIQNIKITNINPQAVFGGDALYFHGSSKIWIDHVTTSSIARQHYAFDIRGNDVITISNSFIDGATKFSATCDGHTYWGLELLGENDKITFYSEF